MSAGNKNAIVIVIDGLQAGMLGCYGNTWIKTPEIDRLAAESFLFDQGIVDGPIPPLMYEAWWTGSRATTLGYTCQGNVDKAVQGPRTVRLPTALSQAGYFMRFVTDEP